MKIKYVGTRDLFSFYELAQADQIKMREEYGENCEEKSYYLNEHDELELFEFLQVADTEGLKSFHGYKSDSYWTGSLVIISDPNDHAERFKLFTFHVEG